MGLRFCLHEVVVKNREQFATFFFDKYRTCTFSRVLYFLSPQQACFVIAVSGVDLVASPLREENQQVC